MIEFFLFLCVARLWKNLEFFSPLAAHKTLEHWSRNLFSLSSNSDISRLKILIRRFYLVCMVSCSAPFSSFLFFSNSLLTFPKWTRFNLFYSLPQFSIFLITCIVGSDATLDDHTASTTLEQPWSANHISSKWKGSVKLVISILSGTMHRGQWSDESNDKWWIIVPANFMSQSLLVRPRSNHSHSEWPFVKWFCQVNRERTNPRSRKPLSSMTSRNNCIRDWLLLLPPIFSELWKISLKYLAHNQGKLCLLFNWRSLFQDSKRLWVAGSP